MHIDQSSRQSGRVFWELVPGTEFEQLSIVAELRAIQNLGPL
jgi:hypothetical protein